MQAMEAERTKVSVARERALVVHQEAQTEHRRAVMMVLPSSSMPRRTCLALAINKCYNLGPCCGSLCWLGAAAYCPWACLQGQQKTSIWHADVKVDAGFSCVRVGVWGVQAEKEGEPSRRRHAAAATGEGS